MYATTFQNKALVPSMGLEPMRCQLSTAANRQGLTKLNRTSMLAGKDNMNMHKFLRSDTMHMHAHGALMVMHCNTWELIQAANDKTRTQK
eukprot:988198-Amphidinium_carterae.2